MSKVTSISQYVWPSALLGCAQHQCLLAQQLILEDVTTFVVDRTVVTIKQVIPVFHSSKGWGLNPERRSLLIRAILP